MNATVANLKYKTDNKPTKTTAKIIKFPQTKNKGGRPSPYTNELADEICIAIMDSDKGIGRLCKEHKHWPSKKTIFNWLKKNEEFKRQYAIAKQIQIHDLMDELLQLPEKTAGLSGRNRRRPLDEDSIYLIRLEMDEIKWKMVHLMPKKHHYENA
ncbi:hypothetical protein [Legionella sp.]|uniref:terminase small subunit-like protein n=1 Tax=Legionella sp. TaxID=459 RepID=UPI003CA21186